MPKLTLQQVLTYLGIPALLVGALIAWDQLHLPRPVLNYEAAAQAKTLEDQITREAASIKGQLAQVQEQTTDTRSRLLNDQLLRTQQQIYENLREQEKYKEMGQDAPPWLIKEWLDLENTKTDLTLQINGLVQ